MTTPTKTNRQALSISGTPVQASRRDLGADFRRMASQPGAKCGNCGKPFNAIRKPAALLAVENEAPGRAVVVSEYLLCRACSWKRRDQGAVSMAGAFQDAESTALLALSPSEGRA